MTQIARLSDLHTSSVADVTILTQIMTGQGVRELGIPDFLKVTSSTGLLEMLKLAESGETQGLLK